MSDIANILCCAAIALEMVLINFYNIQHICTAKHKPLFRYLHFGVWTVAVVLISMLLLNITKVFGNGSGLFIFGGLLFIIPSIIEYKDSFARIIEISCTTWTFTFYVLTFSFQLARIFDDTYFYALVLLIQTIMHALLAPWSAHFINNIFVDTLALLPEGADSKLRLTSVLWLITFVVLNYCLAQISPVAAILALLCTGSLSYLSYNLLHTSLASRLRAEKLKQIAYVDSLTSLPNRAAFFVDGQRLIAQNITFDLVFLDLDHFKKINDTYGHLAGNEYLCGFAASIDALCNGLGRAYRMSGDEFVCILKDGARQDLIVRLVNYKWPLYLAGQPFLGVAAGASRYPHDGTTLDELIHKADKAMYRQKASGR